MNLLVGWISLHRQIQDGWLWQDKPFSKGQAWIDLLLLVNHTDSKVFIDGQLVEVERGQRIISIRQLCDRWGWSNSKVVRFLNVLESDEMLSRKSDTKKTVITIANYSKYQDCNITETTPKRHRNTQTIMI